MSAIAAAVIVGVGAVAGGVMAYQGAKAQGKAAKEAAEIQAKYGMSAIDAETARFLEMKELMQPYAEAGYGSLKTQQDMIGQSGPEAEQAAINQITNGPLFGALTKQGETALLQNASATGGLRGGNVEAALSQFRPNLLSSLMNDRYAKLQSMTAYGQAASAGQAAATQQLGQDTASGLRGIGNAFAQGTVGAGAATAAGYNAIGGAIQGIGNSVAGLDYLKFRQTGTGMF
jgi:hypothetical protein